MYVHMCRPMCMWVNMFRWRPIQRVSLISLHLIYGGRTSQLSSKLADKAGLVSQLALGSPSLPFWDYILMGWFIYSVHFSPYV